MKRRLDHGGCRQHKPMLSKILLMSFDSDYKFIFTARWRLRCSLTTPVRSLPPGLTESLSGWAVILPPTVGVHFLLPVKGRVACYKRPIAFLQGQENVHSNIEPMRHRAVSCRACFRVLRTRSRVGFQPACGRRIIGQQRMRLESQ